MTNQSNDWEFGLRTEGHIGDNGNRESVIPVSYTHLTLPTKA